MVARASVFSLLGENIQMDSHRNQFNICCIQCGRDSLFCGHITPFRRNFRYRGIGGVYNIRSSGRGNLKTPDNTFSPIIKIDEWISCLI